MDRLLTKEEINKINHLKYSPDMSEAELFMVVLRGVAESQDLKTASLVKAEYEAKLKKLADRLQATLATVERLGEIHQGQKVLIANLEKQTENLANNCVELMKTNTRLEAEKKEIMDWIKSYETKTKLIEVKGINSIPASDWTAFVAKHGGK